jgi:hypothetical protein
MHSITLLPTNVSASRRKAILVSALAALLELHPPLASALGRLVLATWPAFRGA